MSNIKTFVKNQYAKWVEERNSCCSADCCQETMSEGYDNVEGYVEKADYGLGCGLPLEYAKLNKGDTVMDFFKRKKKQQD